MQWFPSHQQTIRKGSGTVFSILSWQSLSIAFLGSHGKANLTAVTVKRLWHLWHFPVALVSASTCGQFVEARTCIWASGNMEGYFSPPSPTTAVWTSEDLPYVLVTWLKAKKKKDKAKFDLNLICRLTWFIWISFWDYVKQLIQCW